MRGKLRIGLLVACLTCGWAAAALADKRVALVIGNGTYQNAAKLANPPRDADAIAELFRKANFDIIHARRDLVTVQFRQALSDLNLATRNADIAVVFFAGHGIEINGVNYLLPTDVRLRRDYDVDDEAIPLDRVLRAIEPAKRLRLVILDACRENPFVAAVERSGAKRSVGRGLGKVEPTLSDTLIAYAAKAGSYSDDGDGMSNSPFTAALLAHILTPGLDIRLALGLVRDDVLAKTGNQQEPFVYGSLGGASVSLVPAMAQRPKHPEPEDERADYEFAERINTKPSWERFIKKHPTGYYADLARERLKLLEGPTSPPPMPVLPRDHARKSTFKDCAFCPEMVMIPSGQFQMGSSKDRDDEKPPHTVVIAQNFALGKTEVTVQQFVAFLNSAAQLKQFSERWIKTGPEEVAAPVIRSDNAGLNFSSKTDHAEDPITFVSWYGADAYANWLSKQTGFTYRLPSEAEWEYAARAASTTTYHFGDDTRQLCNYANVADVTGQKQHNWSSYVDCDDGYADLAPVGKFQPNAFGLYDMHGNAAEWVADCWHRTYEGAPADGSPWITGGDCGVRVVRGGSFYNLSTGLRSAKRYVNVLYTKYVTVGFRVARSLR